MLLFRILKSYFSSKKLSLSLSLNCKQKSVSVIWNSKLLTMFMKSFRLVFFFSNREASGPELWCMYRVVLLIIKGSIVSSRKGKIIWIPESKNRLCVSLPIPKIDFEWIYNYIKIINLNLNFGKWFSFEMQCTCMRPAGSHQLAFSLLLPF